MDEYIILGNATQAAIAAGYSEKTAYSQGQRLLKHVEVSKRIKERTEQLFDEKAMDIKEALAISASIARGEPQQTYFKEVDKLTGETTKENARWYTPSIEDRQRSLDHIFKTSGAYLERHQLSADVETDLNIVIDYGDDDAD